MMPHPLCGKPKVLGHFEDFLAWYAFFKLRLSSCIIFYVTNICIVTKGLLSTFSYSKTQLIWLENNSGKPCILLDNDLWQTRLLSEKALNLLEKVLMKLDLMFCFDEVQKINFCFQKISKLVENAVAIERVSILVIIGTFSWVYHVCWEQCQLRHQAWRPQSEDTNFSAFWIFTLSGFFHFLDFWILDYFVLDFLVFQILDFFVLDFYVGPI